MIRGVDASLIYLGLYQGGCPAEHEGTTNIRDAGMAALVLMAGEYQPDASRFPGVEVLHAPIEDSNVTPELWEAADRVSDQVVQRLGREVSVLVTCYEGRNRSGLVCALVLHKLGYSVEDSIDRVRRGRGLRALANPYFTMALRSLDRSGGK
jgi:protein-tyrosine phosphatase